MKAKLTFICFKLFKWSIRLFIIAYLFMAVFIMFLPGIMSAYSPDVPQIYIDTIYNTMIVQNAKKHYFSSIFILPWTYGIASLPLLIIFIFIITILGGDIWS